MTVAGSFICSTRPEFKLDFKNDKIVLQVSKRLSYPTEVWTAWEAQVRAQQSITAPIEMSVFKLSQGGWTKTSPTSANGYRVTYTKSIAPNTAMSRYSTLCSFSAYESQDQTVYSAIDVDVYNQL